MESLRRYVMAASFVTITLATSVAISNARYLTKSDFNKDSSILEPLIEELFQFGLFKDSGARAVPDSGVNRRHRGCQKFPHTRLLFRPGVSKKKPPWHLHLSRTLASDLGTEDGLGGGVRDECPSGDAPGETVEHAY